MSPVVVMFNRCFSARPVLRGRLLRILMGLLGQKTAQGRLVFFPNFFKPPCGVLYHFLSQNILNQAAYMRVSSDILGHYCGPGLFNLGPKTELLQEKKTMRYTGFYVTLSIVSPLVVLPSDKCLLSSCTPLSRTI